ncbi:hypothetical protein ESCO_004437 [Escovopsis weberi]|uniref:DUF7719 domain-containing protein n=1 Tax=Escovopsis weberi TaxID=150374 RepID=A0A0N0RTS7_ESCWE|nr:hypothetical protein ESCO_004437 [Escovopsis weberi]
MVKTRKDRIAEKAVKLAHPDRSAPSEKTLLEIAHERNLFDQASARQAQLSPNSNSSSNSQARDPDDEPLLSPAAERFLEACLWTSTLAMLHFTFDVFVHNQYATRIEWPSIFVNTARSWIVFFIFFYPIHPHAANPSPIPLLPARLQRPARQALFFLASCAAGCALIYVSNAKGYMYNMRRAPTLACLWLWAVVELDLPWAVLSLAVAVAFLLGNGYEIK